MYGWLLCTQMPWEKAGIQNTEVSLFLSCVRVCASITSPAQSSLTTQKLLETEGSACTASAKDREGVSTSLSDKVLWINHTGNLAMNRNLVHIG